MLAIRLPTKLPLSPQTAVQLSRVAESFTHFYGVSSRPVALSINLHLQSPRARRQFSSTSKTQLREFFPEAEHDHKIAKTEAAWPHPPYTVEQMRAIPAHAHRDPAEFSDRVALTIVRFLRTCTDFATGYKHAVEDPKIASDSNAVAATKPYQMSERKWLIRFVFLESIAGVPGMVAGMLRHLRSLRTLKRDNGWIETLLEEAFNERMHLLTFLKMAEPGWFMRLMILGAQGVVFNSLFLSYLIAPRTVHRFVGYLEEEAVLTYTLAIVDIEAGKLPLWTHPRFSVPDLAVDYWKMPEDKRSMRDLLLYIRADEAKHREVNHTLGNLDQELDPNPFVSVYKDPSKPHPSKGIDHIKPMGWERNEVI